MIGPTHSVRVEDNTPETDRQNNQCSSICTMIETYEDPELSHEHNTQELPKEDDRERSEVTRHEATLNPGRSVDAFLWKGDPKATPIQRVGLVIYAFMFLLLFAVLVVVMIVMIVKHDFDWVSFLGVLMVGTLSGVFGFRFLFNVFRRLRHHEVNRQSLTKRIRL